MIALVDASFLINVKRTDLHNYMHYVFDPIIISNQIQEEVVIKGLQFNKKDAILTRRQINTNKIKVEDVPVENIQVIDRLLHLGEASLVSLFEEKFSTHSEILIATDDRIFFRYMKYVYPLVTERDLPPISSLNLVISLFERGLITEDQAKTILIQLERISAHGPEELMEAFHTIEARRDNF